MPQLTESATDRSSQKFYLPTTEVLVSSRRTLILIAAIAVGIFAGIALLNYVRGIEDDVYADAQPVQVLIATEDIPEGTPATLALQMMAPQDIPLEIRPATFIPIDGGDQITGLVSRGLIPKNQIIVQGLFVDPAVIAAKFTDQVPSGQVAMTIQIGQVEAVGGYLQPGDEVNILVKHDNLGCGASQEGDAEEGEGDVEGESPSGPSGLGGLESDELIGDKQWCTYATPTRYLFQRVEILAIGARQTLQPGETGAAVITPQGGAITFMLPNQAAQILSSVSPESIYLTLLPEDYSAEPQRPVPENMIDGVTLAPGEIPECLTPYGPDGFIEGDSVDTVAEEDGEPIAHFACEALYEE